MDAVVGELISRHVVTHVTGIHSSHDQIRDHLVNLVLRVGNVLIPMYERR